MNRSAVAVTVELIAKSCSCADAEVTPRRLEPGQRGVLSIAWQTGAKRDDVTDRITLFAAVDGQTAKLTRELAVRAVVRPDFAIEPAELRFGPKGGTRVLALKPDADPDVRLLEAYAPASGLAVDVDRAKSTVRVTCPPGLAPGRLDVLLHTTSRVETDVTIPVRVTTAEP